MKGYPTSFVRMFATDDDAVLAVERIEIPLIQRDYAQGRVSPRVDEIRNIFLDVLHRAVTDGEPIGLDFIYGEVTGTTLEPLDGQQRLTTLFLLHWYLAFRTDRLAAAPPWTNFSYATRPSARLFCERIVENPPPADLAATPSAWLKDQHWYLHVWRFDPTIRSMLVMADAIAARFEGADLEAAWRRLTDDANPAVGFQLLPIDEMGSAADLYIKMNSRGKPLTEFEVFKTQLGGTLTRAGRGGEFSLKIDGSWSDLLWDYRGDNDIVDDEFMCYFDFVLEVCEWREDRGPSDRLARLAARAEALLAVENPQRGEHLGFLFDAFDAWEDGGDIRATFDSIFATTATPGRVCLFGTGEVNINLFEACCDHYGETRGKARVFSLGDTLLLYATLIHRIEGTEDAPRRLRQLRNMNEASEDEIRLQNMPGLINAAAEFMRTGSLDVLGPFNQNQVSDERRKQALVTDRPELETVVQRLEDHPVLRGTLVPIELDGDSLQARAEAFEEAFLPERWPTLTGALLAVGEYQLDWPKSDYHLFGSPRTEGAWRKVLVDRGDPETHARARSVLSMFLDAIGASPDPAATGMQTIIDMFLAERVAAAEFDWRYYLVRYPEMREGNSGIYYGAEHKLGYQMTMLLKTVQRSYYRDPYLLAIWRASGSPEAVEDPWFYGYSTDERWMRLERSGAALRSVPVGIALQKPPIHEPAAAFEAVCKRHPDVVQADGQWMLQIRQEERGGTLVDSEDRVQKASCLLHALTAAGL